MRSNTVLKILSLLLAIALWAFVLGEVNPTVKKTIHGVPVEFTSVDTLEDRELAMVTQEGYTVDIVIEGARSDVGQLEISDIQATADLYGYDEEGENQVSVDVVLPSKLSLEEVKTPDITVVLEELVSVSKPVTVEFTGKTADKTEATAVEVAPSEVEVKGAKSVVNRVDTVKVKIDSEELTEEVEVFNIVPSAYTKNDKPVKNVSISANKVEVEAVLYHTKTVDLKVKTTGTSNNDAKVTIPDEITIKGTAESLARITSIATDYVDISEITENTVLPIDLMLPYGVEIADISKDIGVKIEFD